MHSPQPARGAHRHILITLALTAALGLPAVLQAAEQAASAATPDPVASADRDERILDLHSAVQRALQVEAGYRAAQAANRSAHEEIPRARGALLPQLSASGTRFDNDADIHQPGPFGEQVRRENEYISKNYSLTLRQPLWRRDAWVRYRQAENRAAYADQQLASEEDRLILRIGEAYLNGLLADAAWQLAEAEVRALQGLVDAATRGLDAGTATRTDLLDAQARLASAQVRHIEARQSLDAARRTLESALARPVDQLRDLDPARLVEPRQFPPLQDWMDAALAANPEVAAARHGIDIARREVQLQQAGHHPSLDLIAQRRKEASDSVTSIGTTYYTTNWGLQLNIPLYSGGSVSAATRQAAARLEQAQADYDAAVERIRLHTGRAYEAFKAAAQRVQALARTEEAATAALTGNEKGLQAGTRSFIDVLNARQQVFEARRERARANVDFVYSLLELNAAAGQLDQTAVERVNALFGSAPLRLESARTGG